MQSNSMWLCVCYLGACSRGDSCCVCYLGTYKPCESWHTCKQSSAIHLECLARLEAWQFAKCVPGAGYGCVSRTWPGALKIQTELRSCTSSNPLKPSSKIVKPGTPAHLAGEAERAAQYAEMLGEGVRAQGLAMLTLVKPCPATEHSTICYKCDIGILGETPQPEDFRTDGICSPLDERQAHQKLFAKTSLQAVAVLSPKLRSDGKTQILAIYIESDIGSSYAKLSPNGSLK